MTDRHVGYLVVLKKGIREDDAEGIITALRHIKEVVSVKPYIGDINLIIAKETVRAELKEKLWSVLNEP